MSVRTATPTRRARLTRGSGRLAVVVCVAAVLSTALAVRSSASSSSRSQHPATRSTTLQRSTTQLASCSHLARGSGGPRLDARTSRLLRDFTLSYCTVFPGRGIPRGWFKFNGVPGGDPSGLFARSHVSVAGGHLLLRVTWGPHRRRGWASAGICHCGMPRLYGAFFVRSRVTGPGPDEIDLLWPVAHVWPPEIDFNESAAQTKTTTWSDHFGQRDEVVHGDTRINLLRWHTWGVIWTPDYLKFVVDGYPWGAVTRRSAIPHLAMTLDIQNQTFCGRGTECPIRPVTMQVGWVAEYALATPRP